MTTHHGIDTTGESPDGHDDRIADFGNDFPDVMRAYVGELAKLAPKTEPTDPAEPGPMNAAYSLGYTRGYAAGRRDHLKGTPDEH